MGEAMRTPEANASAQGWVYDSRKAGYTLAAACGVSIGGVGALGWLNGPPAISLSVTVTPGQSSVPALVALSAFGAAVVLVTFVLFLLHEWCHGRVFRWAGARPQYGAKFLAWFLPVFYATAPGYWLTKRQYLAVILAPTVVINGLGVLVLLFSHVGLLLVLPLALHLGGCVGDWWMAAVVARLPRGTLFEDNRDGFRYRPARLPSAAEMSPETDRTSPDAEPFYGLPLSRERTESAADA